MIANRSSERAKRLTAERNDVAVNLSETLPPGLFDAAQWDHLVAGRKVQPGSTFESLPYSVNFCGHARRSCFVLQVVISEIVFVVPSPCR